MDNLVKPPLVREDAQCVELASAGARRRAKLELYFGRTHRAFIRLRGLRHRSVDPLLSANVVVIY